jgi:hypothetical protein
MRPDICNVLTDNSYNKNFMFCHCSDFRNDDPSDTIPIVGAQLELFVKKIIFSLQKVLHHMDRTPDQNIEMSEVTSLKGKGFGRDERGIVG